MTFLFVFVHLPSFHLECNESVSGSFVVILRGNCEIFTLHTSPCYQPQMTDWWWHPRDFSWELLAHLYFIYNSFSSFFCPSVPKRCRWPSKLHPFPSFTLSINGPILLLVKHIEIYDKIVLRSRGTDHSNYMLFLRIILVAPCRIFGL